MKGKLSRRAFLRLAGGTAVVGAAATVLPTAAREFGRELTPYTRPPEELLPGGSSWFASTCRQCAAGCGIIVRTTNGRAKKIEGNPLYPLNQGKLCARGHASLQALYNPDRLQNAVVQNPRGSEQFTPIQWTDGLEQLLEKVETADPSKIVFWGGQMSDHLYYLVSSWLAAIGAPPPVQYDLLTAMTGRTTAAAAAETLFGFDQLPVYDIANADVLFSFGANFLETWQSPVAYSRAYGNFRGQSGGRGFFVQFEPRLSATAASADEWVPLRPGMDGLVALALGRIIVAERLGNVGTFGQTYADFYQGVDVETIANASGVSVETLHRMANILATADRPIVIPGGYLSSQTNGYNSTVAIQALNLVLSRLGRRGGVYLSSPAPSDAFGTAPPPNSFAQVQEVIERMEAGDVDLLLVHGANPVFELPETAGFKEALVNVPTVVSFSPFVNETVIQSDLTLPDHTELESWGYQVASPGTDRPAVSSQQPVVLPVYDTRSTTSVILALAEAMGGAVAEAVPWGDEMLFLEDMSGTLFGSSLSPYGTKSAGEFWAAWRQFGGWWADRELPIEPEPVGFENEPLSAAGPTFDGPAREFPFMFYPYPSMALSDGRGANLPWLQEMPDPMTTAAWNTWVELNPETAHKLGVTDNDVVTITSLHGEMEAIVVVYPGIRPDVVAVPVGEGHSSYGRYAKDRGSNPVDLLGTATDTETGTLAWGATRVRIERAGQTHHLARMESLDGEGRERLT
ncbi:MAG: molybdopterin-dependent oxidoreductase [Chloroflexi bacterium]|nr:molybdopterin-dependent oxidoreductase [Chloroflexota bacterium]